MVDIKSPGKHSNKILTHAIRRKDPHIGEDQGNEVWSVHRLKSVVCGRRKLFATTLCNQPQDLVSSDPGSWRIARVNAWR